MWHVVSRTALISVACAVMTVVGVLATAQRDEFLDPIPEQTVDAIVSPLVYQGGTVVVRATVKNDGSVSDVEVVLPVPALTEPVVEAVRQWRFRPAMLNGRAVQATTTVAVQIVLMRTVIPR